MRRWRERRVKGQGAKGATQSDGEQPDPARDADALDDQADEEGAAQEADETEGGRKGPSLYDTVAPEASAGKEPEAAGQVVIAQEAADPVDTLRRSRVRWLVVRLSYRARGFLAQAPQHFVRLVSILRYFEALTAALPEAMLTPMLAPMLGPAYRCASTRSADQAAALPSVSSLADAVALDPAQRIAFLEQLGQGLLDALSCKMQDAGRGQGYTAALSAVRKAVEKQRSARVQRRRLLPVMDPEAAAQRKRTRNRQRGEAKKRKVQDVINTRRGGPSATSKARKLRTLAQQ